MIDQRVIQAAKAHFGTILEEQLKRVERLKKEGDWVDYSGLDTVVIGILAGDGIGVSIAAEAQRVLAHLLKDDLHQGRVEFRVIDGLTIENRARNLQAIPEDVLEEIKKCHVTLKGPTTTPESGDGWPNIESANVAMRKELDLFANVRPVHIPSEGIDWTFFRENTEGLYALGSRGFHATPDLAVDFRVVTSQGSERIIDAAFAYAKRTGRTSVTVVTKANIIKATDGKFLDVARAVAERYPGIEWQGWYVDIMAAKLLDSKRRAEFQVFVLPNLYGDILTDEAAQMQGGVGTAGGANIGKRHAMFEAIHGSAPRMVREGRAKYADPSSMINAASLLMQHIGYVELGDKLRKALDVCGQYERKLVMTGRSDGPTGAEFGDYLMDTIADPSFESRWEGYVRGDRT